MFATTWTFPPFVATQWTRLTPAENCIRLLRIGAWAITLIVNGLMQKANMMSKASPSKEMSNARSQMKTTKTCQLVEGQS